MTSEKKVVQMKCQVQPCAILSSQIRKKNKQKKQETKKKKQEAKKGEALLMSAHNICFRGEIRKISILLDWKKRLN